MQMMEIVGEVPVDCLHCGEVSRVWSGWALMKNREVIREASAKGTHIDLAYQFLSRRKSCPIDQAQEFFNYEVEIWINELLQKRQVHRASHILSNVGKNPLEYIRNICINSSEVDLRDYLATHIIQNEGFSESDIEAWDVIKCIKVYTEKYKLSEDMLQLIDTLNLNCNMIDSISVQKFFDLPQTVKDSLITELYFHTYEPRLSTQLKTDNVWDYLLSNNEVDLLQNWIYIRFNNDKSIVTDENLVETFRKLEITEEMIERIQDSNAAIPVKEYLFNHLVQYGIFTQKDQQNIKLTLSRLFGSLITPSDFNKIISQQSCNLNCHNFFQKIHSIIYYQSTPENYDTELYLKDKNLLNLLCDLKESSNFDHMKFHTALIETIYRITDNVDEYLKANPLIMLQLIVSHYKHKLSNENLETPLDLATFIYDNKNEIMKNVIINSEYIEVLFKNIPYLKDAVNDTSKKQDITMYQLLQGFKNLDAQELFKWRQKSDDLPHFRSKNLIKKYGHKEELTYKYYIKEGRPSMAAYILQNRHSKMRNNLSSKMKSRIAFESHNLGIKFINDPKITSTCIAFIELIGMNSEYFRFHVTAADYVKNKLNISINDLLQSVTYQNLQDLAIVMNHLERSFKSECNEVSMSNVDEFITVLKSWSFIVNFARIHNAAFPTLFLKYLARNNQCFEFVLVGHIFNYPLEQLLENAMEFGNPNIREHLLISLSNSHVLAEAFAGNDYQKNKSLDMKSLNSFRTHFKRSESESNNMTESLNNVQYFPLNQSNFAYNNNLWVIILKCHQSPDPPGALLKTSREYKSPILTIFAACYEPSATPIYCYSWLVISINNHQLTQDYSNCLDDQIWSARKVSNLFKRMVSLGYIDTLSRGFQIFMPDHCLTSFFNFLAQYVKDCEFKTCTKFLENFLINCSTLKSNKMFDWDDLEMTYSNNEYWIAIVAIECILTVLGKCLQSIELQTKLLSILVEKNFNSLLHLDQLNFKMLWEIVTSLESTTVKIDLTSIKLTENSSNIIEEVEKCIEKLTKASNFTTALELANIAKLSCAKIILDQYRNELKRSASTSDDKFDIKFWGKCAQDIKKYNVGFEDAAAFFVEHAEKVKLHKERYEILRLAHETLKPICTNQQTIDTIEMAMWKSCILAGPISIEIETETRPFNKLKTELLSKVSNLQVSCVLNDKNERNAVEALINRFIEAEDLETALRISAIFNYKHHDLKILMLCMSLAEGEISSDELNIRSMMINESDTPEPKSVLKRQSIRRQSGHYLSAHSPRKSFSGETLSVNNLNDIYESGEQSTTFLIKKRITLLIKTHLKHESNVGNKILLLYKLSILLQKSYNLLLVYRDPMEFLLELTGVESHENFDLMHDVITIFRLKNTEVSKFFAGEIIVHITKQVEEDLDDFMLMWSCSLSLTLPWIRYISNEILSGPSLIGWELIRAVNLRLGHSHGLKRDYNTLKIVAELLIVAHDFFTDKCNMEGIATVLRKCQNFANVLQNQKLWNLLGRLVTGVGRFNEMNYILKILKENDQFETLLRKSTVNRSGLRTALLEFCKKQYPEDKESFRLVTEHFLLFTENAMRWENYAKTVIRELIKETRKESMNLTNNFQGTIKLKRNNKTEAKLRESMSNYTHATENYLKDDKLIMANRCSHQAQLIALQLSLLNSVSLNEEVMCLLNLSDEEVNEAMCQTLSFSQILIVVDAYDHNVDWPTVIYHHVILNGESKFLKEFLAYKRLSPAIVQDCVCRFRAETNRSKEVMLNMQSLIVELTDVECKYVLASQLGFKNIVETMLADPNINSYLKDTVWKQGFNPQRFIGENFRS